MIYLNFNEYVVFGGECDEAAFNKNIDRACAVIDSYTHKRVESMESVPRCVKVLCRDLIDYYSQISLGEKSITSWSESGGPVSQSISYQTKTSEDIDNDVKNLVYDYLLGETNDKGTPLLYKGVCDE